MDDKIEDYCKIKYFNPLNLKIDYATQSPFFNTYSTDVTDDTTSAL